MAQFMKSLTFLSILFYFIWVLEVRSADVDVSSTSDALLCRRCGHEITSAEHLTNVGSNLALRQRNDTILHVHKCLIQLFKNPDGQYFELITAHAANIKSQGVAYKEHSWFPAFAWRVAVCPQCGTHLGWSFEDPKHSHDDVLKEGHPNSSQEKDKEEQPTKYTFVGLIFPHLIQQNYADSLIITPGNAYRS